MFRELFFIVWCYLDMWFLEDMWLKYIYYIKVVYIGVDVLYLVLEGIYKIFNKFFS